MPRPTGILLEDPEVVVDRRIMGNGEERVRTTASGGSAYIRTIAKTKGEWQNAHVHLHTSEFYVVVVGWMAVVEKLVGPDDYTMKIYKPSQTYLSKPGVEHNIYLPAHAKIDTLKYRVSAIADGDRPSDYYDAEPKFDAWSKSFTEAMIAGRVGVSLESLLV